VDEPRIALAASPREWAQALHRHVADHGGARVRATVLHQQDAIAEDYDVFIGDDSTSFLTRRLVDALQGCGRAVLGVFDPEDPRGKGELVDMGVDEVIARDADPGEFLAAITALHARQQPRMSIGAAEHLDDPLPHGAHTDRRDEARIATPAPAAEAHAGRVVAVGGAGGGTGATEIAIGLAQACGRRGGRTVLVDVDEVAPSIAQRLGLPLYPNLRAAADALDHRTQPLDDLLTEVADGGFRALPGLSTARSWAELRPNAGADVIDGLRTSAHTVIANVGPLLEDLATGGGAPRYGLTRTVLSMADVVVVVAQPTPLGLARLLDWLGDLRVVAEGDALHVVFDRAPTSRYKQGELTEELARSTNPAGLWFVPEDPRVGTAAWAGTLAAAGPFTRALHAAALRVVPPPAGGARRRRRRVRS
jgi:MinD-like ATPase involved in chromosome partitioning or flagellar assembly